MTLDYGPFGFLERFDPMHCPWVGGGAEYSFGRQPQAHLGRHAQPFEDSPVTRPRPCPQAAAINLSILSEAWADLLRAVATEEGLTRAEADEAVQLSSCCSSGSAPKVRSGPVGAQSVLNLLTSLLHFTVPWPKRGLLCLFSALKVIFFF